MPRRDHLVPSTTVDRNGYVKTVYVNPGGGSPSLSALAFSSPSICGNDEPDEWANLRDPGSWEANGFDPDDAEDWEHAGFEDGDDASEWRDNDYDFADAWAWKSAGFDPDDAKEWQRADYEPDEAKKWHDGDIDPAGAKVWKDAGVDDPEDAIAWGNVGFEADVAKEWRAAKFDPDDAEAWKEGASRASRSTVDELAELKRLGAEADDASMWLNLLADVRQMEDGKDETLETLWRTMDGEFPGSGDEYQRYFPYRQWNILAEAGIDGSLVSQVQEIQEKVESRWESEHYEGWEDGDPEYESDPDGALELACDWFRGGEIMVNKVAAVRGLIAAGATPNDCSGFLLNREWRRYDEDDAENILWACRVAAKLDTPQLREEAFLPLFEALGSDGVRELAEKHGLERFGTAVQAGMRTAPQLRTYLEDISVAGIADGAL